MLHLREVRCLIGVLEVKTKTEMTCWAIGVHVCGEKEKLVQTLSVTVVNVTSQTMRDLWIWLTVPVREAGGDDGG